MSLVEKAVGHLEQLRKAGQEMSGDLGFPPSQANVSDANDVGSTIERAAGGSSNPPGHVGAPTSTRIGRTQSDTSAIGATGMVVHK